MKVALPVIEQKGKGYWVSPHFGKARKFYIFDTESGEAKIVDLPEVERGRGRLIAETLKREGVEFVFCREIGEGAKEKLEEVGIEVRSTGMSRVEEVVEAFTE